MKNLFILLLALSFYGAAPVYAQDQPQPQPSPTAEEVAKQKAELEKNAYRLLEQVIDEAQSLRLTENRVRVQIVAADLLWDSNQGRARSLFGMASEGVAELGRNQQQNNNNNRRPTPPNFARGFYQLRQELVLAAARHDAQLAYQLLAATKPPAVIQPDQDPRAARNQISPDDGLEQVLLGRIAAIDPKFAALNAEQMMDKGTFPRTMPEVLTQLQKQDADAAAKLADKTVKKLQSANLLTNNEALSLTQMLLQPGPRPAAAPDAKGSQVTTSRGPVLDQGSYVDLLSTVVDLALKATPPQNTQRPAGPNGGGVGPGRRGVPTVIGSNAPLTDAQMEQFGARTLLAGLQRSLPLVDQYLPGKSAQVRQKLTDFGIANSPANSQANRMQAMATLANNPSADALLQAASVAPPQMQPRLYQQAASKALDEGDTSRARQIATDHLQANARDSLMQRIDFREMVQKGEGTRLENIRQYIAGVQSDSDKLDLLIQLAHDMQPTNPKLATQLLDEARQITSRRATSYDQFEQQLRVARAFATLDSARTFEILDTGISQLNELLSAAAVLNGFEVTMFRDGEMSMQAPSGLTSMVNRFGQELAQLAHSDFDRAETLTGHFQLSEPRIMTRLAIVQGILPSKRN